MALTQIVLQDITKFIQAFLGCTNLLIQSHLPHNTIPQSSLPNTNITSKTIIHGSNTKVIHPISNSKSQQAIQESNKSEPMDQNSKGETVLLGGTYRMGHKIHYLGSAANSARVDEIG